MRGFYFFPSTQLFARDADKDYAMVDRIQNFAKKLEPLLATPAPTISADLSRELCVLADQGGTTTQYLYGHMLNPQQQAKYGQIDRENVVGGRGFVYRPKDGDVICFNFSGKGLPLPCHPETASQDVLIRPQPLRWHANAKEVCQATMKTWTIYQKELTPEEAIVQIKGNLPSVSLVEALIPKAFPDQASLDENIRRLHRLLSIILQDESIEASLKKRYGFYLQKRLTFYLLQKEGVTVIEKTQYQSAVNKMLNDFNRFLETPFTAFNREATGVLSWKSFIALFLGGSLYFAYYPAWRERIRMKDQQRGQKNYVPPSKATKAKAQFRAGVAAMATSVAIYLGFSALLAYAKQEAKREEGLEPCFPPGCPLILLNDHDR